MISRGTHAPRMLGVIRDFAIGSGCAFSNAATFCLRPASVASKSFFFTFPERYSSASTYASALGSKKMRGSAPRLSSSVTSLTDFPTRPAI